MVSVNYESDEWLIYNRKENIQVNNRKSKWLSLKNGWRPGLNSRTGPGVASAGEANPRVWEQDNRSCLLPAALGELAGAVLESLPWWRQGEKAGRMTNPAASQPQNWDYEVAHTNIHRIYELLKCVKEPNLQIEN